MVTFFCALHHPGHCADFLDEYFNMVTNKVLMADP